jgi:hypothetical protein
LRHEISLLPGSWLGLDVELTAKGIERLAELRGRDVRIITQSYCGQVGRACDPALRVSFAAHVRYAKTDNARPWWLFLRDEAQSVMKGHVAAAE